MCVPASLITNIFIHNYNKAKLQFVCAMTKKIGSALVKMTHRISKSYDLC